MLLITGSCSKLPIYLPLKMWQQMQSPAITSLVSLSSTTGATSHDSTASHGVADNQTTGQGFAYLDTLVQSLLEHGLSKSTRIVYQSGWRKYLAFCSTFNRHPLPFTPYNRCTCAAYISQTTSESTVRIYLSAVRFFQIKAGWPDPSQISCPKIPYVLHKRNSELTT